MGFTVAIIGVGHVGSDLAYSLVTQGIADNIILLDESRGKANGELFDLQDMAALQAGYTQVTVGGYADIAAADVAVIAIGPKTTLRQDRLEELAETAQSLRTIIPQLVRAGFQGLVLNITNPCDVITGLIQQLSGFAHQRVIGTGTLLDTARMQRIVAQQLAVAAKSVEGYVLAEHGESQFVAWSTVRVAGIPLANYPSATTLDYVDLQQKVRAAGWQVLQNKGWTSFAIASAAATVLRAIAQDAHLILPLSSYDAEQGCYLGAPTCIGNQGVITRHLPPLTESEQQLYQQSAQIIGQAQRSLQ